MCSSATKCFAPTELGLSGSSWSINIWSRWDRRLPRPEIQTGLLHDLSASALAIIYELQSSFATVYCDRRTRYESRLVR
jgi:hypothetical protein